MKKVVIISTVAVLVVVALLLVINSTTTITGGAFSYTYKEIGSYSCEDSDGDQPSGESYFTKSTATRKLISTGKIMHTYDDYCVNKRIVKEFRCMPDARVRSKKAGCDEGCIDGACVRPS